MPIVTLLTDFGTRDYYVAAVKGVILGIAPDVRIVDVSHDVEPHNVLHAAFLLRQTVPWFPPGTIHLVIVDPAVGTDRRIILGQYAEYHVIAPDNGIVTLLEQDTPAESVHVLENPKYFLTEVSTTFHGRDMLAPVAAHLAVGVAASSFGPKCDGLRLLQDAGPAERTDTGLVGRVLYVDRFGTMVTNVAGQQLEAFRKPWGEWNVSVNGESIGTIRSAYADSAIGKPVALIGSCGLLEIAVNQGRAVDRFGPASSVSVEVS